MPAKPLWSLLICCVACVGGGEGPAEPGPGPEDQGPLVQVDGLVVDSLRGSPVPRATVSLGDTGTLTDEAGRFRLFVPQGPAPLLVLALGHETRSQVLTVNGTTRSTVQLRRLSPFLQACAVQADTIHALIVELQGRKTLNRREGSTVSLTTPSGTTVLDGFAWRWTAIDNVTWWVRIPVPGASPSRISWQLRDTDDNMHAADCSQVAPPSLPQNPDSLN